MTKFYRGLSVRRMSRILVVVGLVGLIGVAACRSDKKAENETVVDVPLSNTFASDKALARAALAALRDSSAEALYKLQVTEQEYKEIFWPALPETETQGFPVATAWEWVERDARKAIYRALSDYGKKDLKLNQVYANGTVKDFGRIKVIRDLRMVIELPNGEEEHVKLLNNVVVWDGQYKVIAFDS